MRFWVYLFYYCDFLGFFLFWLMRIFLITKSRIRQELSYLQEKIIYWFLKEIFESVKDLKRTCDLHTFLH